MLYLRNIFKQDLRDGKQIAFPKEVSNVFFQFNYSLPDPDRQITFKYKLQDTNSLFYDKSGEIITTRLYAAASESRIDGELKRFLRDDLKASIGDILVIKYVNQSLYEFDFIPKSDGAYGNYKSILKSINHEVIVSDDCAKHDESDENGSINLQNEFADWFILQDGIKHNYFKDSFHSDKTSLVEALFEYEAVYEGEFHSLVFSIPSDDSKAYISNLEQNLYKESGKFFEFSKTKSNHMPRAILGKKNFLSFLTEKFSSSKQEPTRIKIIDNQVEFSINNFQHDCQNSGLFYENLLISRFVSSLITKPFLILTGLSGSGKTKLAQAFVQWLAQSDRLYRVIPVGADWTNREPLLGYPNALKPEEYVKPESGVIDLIIQSNLNEHLPHFLILDEMNLSHVERYFADFLSVMESSEKISLYAEGTRDNRVPPKLSIPSNLFIIGTVNIDETTNMFSPKVLDRANTIEFRVTSEEMESFLGNIKEINMDALSGKGAGMAKSFLEMAANKSFLTEDIDKINKVLVRFFGELKKTGAEFGYRSATEILRLIHQLSVVDDSLKTNQKIDIAIMQKLLPKLHGSRRKLCPVLETLGSFCIAGDIKITKDIFENSDFDFNGANVLYPLSLEKIARMYRGAIDNGFASFAEA